MWTLELTDPPAAEPLDLGTEVAQQLRISADEATAQAAVLASYVEAARTACEDYTGRQLITATWTLRLETWFEEGIYRCENGVERLRLPRPPCVDVASIKYTNSAGGETTWAADEYEVSAPEGPGAQRAEVFLADGYSWPSDVLTGPGAIRIEFDAGYGTAFGDVPATLRAGMLLRVAEMYERRTEATTGTIQSRNQQVAETLWSNFRAW